MKARLVSQRRFLVESRKGKQIVVEMDVYQVSGKDAETLPGGYRFSWIAFNTQNPMERVLFDSHPPKGPHFHIDNRKNEIKLEWTSLAQVERLFFRIVARHFDISPKELR
jgi:hypothetical protein